VKTHRTAAESLALGLYSAALRVLTPAVLLRYWWRGRAEPTYRLALPERLGRYAGKPSTGMVWVHAVSLGETRAATALIAALRDQIPNLRLLLTPTAPRPAATLADRCCARATSKPGCRSTRPVPRSASSPTSGQWSAC
jgi:3-deoxy-D-manno-octulosonic-acid transferase